MGKARQGPSFSNCWHNAAATAYTLETSETQFAQHVKEVCHGFFFTGHMKSAGRKNRDYADVCGRAHQMISSVGSTS